MASLKAIRKRIASIKSTQKITRAMKMVAGARLARAQARIIALRPYAVKTQEVLAAVVSSAGASTAPGGEGEADVIAVEPEHPLLAERPERRVAIVVLTSDRGLCGAFNSNISKTVERAWHERAEKGQDVRIYTVGRKGREYFRRRHAPVAHNFTGIWEALDVEAARRIARAVIQPFLAGELDAIYLAYNEFKSAMTQRVVFEPLLPLRAPSSTSATTPDAASGERPDYLFEPDKKALLERLVPMYIEIALFRALLESNASELGARMTSMDAATKNAKVMIDRYTLMYNRARQAAITKELVEIIGGAEALKG